MYRSEKEYKGVKGWLLLLCVNLTIVDPVFGFANIMMVTETMQPKFSTDPGLFRLIFIGGICSICLIVYSLYAGVSLWRVTPNAVKTAKRYFVASFLYAIFSMFLPALVGLSKEMEGEILKTLPLTNLIVVLYVGTCFRYLQVSRRVKATYGDDKPTQ